MRKDGVTDCDEFNKRDLIKVAMSRVRGDVRNPAPDFMDGRALTFRREQDQALKRAGLSNRKMRSVAMRHPRCPLVG